MKKTILMLALTSLTTAALAKTVTASVYTEISKDCIMVSQATEEAPIDFYTRECKAFGGYKLFESGGDLRYGPELSFEGKTIDVQSPESFHQMASDKIEWVYDLTQDKEGSGEIKYKALIFRLGIDSNPLKTKDATALFVIKLDGAKSCVIGRVATNAEARALANNTAAKCVTLDQ